MKTCTKIIGTIFYLIIALIVSVFIMCILLVGYEVIFIPNDFLFYEHSQLVSSIFPVIIVVPILIIFELIIEKIAPNKFLAKNETIELWKRIGKWKIAIIVAWIVALYCCFTSYTCVTATEIITHSPINPLGTHYNYSDVQSIKTGFGSKSFAILDYKEKGNFFYEITLDNREIVFYVPSPNGDIERYYEHSYLELEEFDTALTALDIPKTASDEWSEYCEYDKEYVDRFLRIVHNTN